MTTGDDRVSIRPARPSDRPALYDVCLRTGDLGADATARFRDPALLGEVYAGPYLALEPDLAFVLVEDDGTVDGTVGGYVLGARDTADFERRCEREWWPPLRERYPLERWRDAGPDGEVVDLLHHPRLADPGLLATHPSHLHVDLLPAWQGAGWGRRLVGTLLDALVAAGSPGVHLGVARGNERAIAFYRRLGFTELGGDDGGLTLGRRLDA